MMRHLCSSSPTKNKRHRLIATVGITALVLFLHAFVTRKGDDDNAVSDNKIISLVSEEDGSVSAQMTKWKTTTDKADTDGGTTPMSVQMTAHLSEKRRDMCVVPSRLPEVLEKRRKDAQEACERLRDELPLRWKRKDRGPSSGILSKLRWDPKRHLVYCHLPKVASTTWAWHLLRSAGLKDEEIAAHPNVHILLRERLPPPSVEDHDNEFLKDSLAFVVSRHPFHRLVSAYKNKIIEAEKRRQHYVDLRTLILERYHRQKDLTNSTMPTFRDFCEYIADTTEDWLSDLNHKEPPDPHWMPMTYMCSPCNLHYDIYSKMETMKEDALFISAQCGLEDVIRPGAMFNPSSNAQQEEKDRSNNSDDIPGARKVDSSLSNAEVENKTRESEENSYAKYLEELSKEEVDRLYNIYKFDFEIFGYSDDSYR